MKVSLKIPRAFLFSVVVAPAAFLTSCNHKELVDEMIPTQNVKVVFDWSKAPQADPASMEAVFFSADGQSLRYDFTGRDGGEIKIPVGTYSALALNSDNTDWARFRNVSDVEEFELYTPEAGGLEATGLRTRAIPRAPETEEEPLTVCPGMLWSAREDNMTLTIKDTEKEFRFYPEEVVCHYTVTVIGIKNPDYLGSAAVDGTLSGMSGGYDHGQRRASDTRVTHPFVLSLQRKTNTLRSEFLTFGENPNRIIPHKLTIYLILSDGSRHYYIYDVSDQIRTAPDPRHVNIVVSGLTVPKPVTSGGGLLPEVDDWQSEYVDLKM